VSFVASSDARLVADIEKLIRNKIEIEPFELEDSRGGERRERLNDGSRPYRDEERGSRRGETDERADRPPASRPASRPTPRPAPKPVDPFFDRPYEPSPQAPEQPAWESSAKVPSRVSANIKTKRKVAALFKATD
jgi:hypothetical protein